MRFFTVWLALGPLGCLSQTTLSIPSVNSEQVSLAQSPRILNIPSFPSLLNLSIALCNGTSSLHFFISNGTITNDPGIQNAGKEIFLNGGLSNWQGIGPVTLFAYSGGTGSQNFQVGLTTDQPIFRNTSTPPLLGDTTATQVLIFSPPFQDAPVEDPTYPNYTLLPANVSTMASSPTSPLQTLLVFQTSNISSSLVQLNQSACGITHVPGNMVAFGNPLTTTTVLRDANGWRTQWVLEGLTPSTNYTAYVVENTTVVSAPLYFLTKSASFPCPLAHSIPFCPAVAYAVPIPLPQGSGSSLTLDSLSPNITDPILSSMSNFTQSLLTFACGRDIYSPLQTCASCQEAYRAWLCAVSFPRCTEPAAAAAQSPIHSALQSYGANDTTRSLNIGPLGQNFSELLPCIETCQAVTRSCPSFLQWVCPLNAVNANASYGVGYIDSTDGEQGMGLTGAPQDRFGNVWCNLP